jgi:hypothetical protein
METFNSPRKRHKPETTRSMALLDLPRDLCLGIAATLVATELARPIATKDLVNFALTCKALHQLLFDTSANATGVTQARYIHQRLLTPAPSSNEPDTFGNLRWRVTFETDLCVLVLYRHDIVMSAVKRVAFWAANYLETQRSLGVKASKVALAGSRYFGSQKEVPEDKITVDTAIDLLRRGDRIETMMVLLQMIHDHVVAAVDQGRLSGVPDVKHFRNSSFERAKQQVCKISEGKSAPQSRRFGITDSTVEYHDIPEHSFAIGRVERSGDRTRGFGRDQDNEKLPFVGGPSGSAISLIRIGLAAGVADDDEHARQYLLAIIVYLVGGGQHSVAEVMYGLAPVLTKIRYQQGRYRQLLPKSLLDRGEWKRMERKYKDYFDAL